MLQPRRGESRDSRQTLLIQLDLDLIPLKVETCSYRFESSTTEPLGDCDIKKFDSDYDSISLQLHTECTGWEEEEFTCTEKCEKYTRTVVDDQPCLHQTEPDTFNYTIKRAILTVFRSFKMVMKF